MAAQSHRLWVLRRSVASFLHGGACLSWRTHRSAICREICATRYVEAFAGWYSNARFALRLVVWGPGCAFVLHRLAHTQCKGQTFQVARRVSVQRTIPSQGTQSIARIRQPRSQCSWRTLAFMLLGTTPNPAVNRTAKQRPCVRCLVPSALRAPAAGYLERWAS